MRIVKPITQAILFYLSVSSAYAYDIQCSDLSFDATNIGLGIGVSWGDVTAKISEKTVHFTVSGIGLAEAGFNRIDAKGKLCLSDNPDDLTRYEGIYVGIGVAASVVAGGGTWVFVNQHDATLSISGLSQGLNVGLPFKTLTLKLN
ncbi:MAG: hypothetical protein M0R33_21015 [Methylomonas sp.]|jgi:hypothetical protein|uniref:hypothetical protein n=1 Tax=Methylomonas sp. TaxID=418 RepID=UPI0025E52824|nr:hypothetical protein [Methylomonas sp.]MCK9608929.1 hypothetical protein [Methylomonas sp.]